MFLSCFISRRTAGSVSFMLLIFGNIIVALTGVNMTTSSNLDCTNDYVKHMFCKFDAQNCAEHNLTLLVGYATKSCIFHTCDTVCCCSMEMILVIGDTRTATVWKGGRPIKSQIIDITSTIKPKTPTITSVRESNGNYEVRWRTNMNDSIISSLDANVTYYKKGDTQKVYDFVSPINVDEENYYEILGKRLEPSTTYVVSVKSYLMLSSRFSDSSNEVEFTTAVSHDTLLLGVIISLSIFAVIITGAIYGLYVKFKTKWWDVVTTPQVLIYPDKPKSLKPEAPIISSVFVEPHIPDERKSWSKGFQMDTSSGSPQHSSGISTASSSLSYANTEPADVVGGVQDALSKAFPHISPISPWTTKQLLDSNKDNGLPPVTFNPCGFKTDDMSSGSSGFDNKTYSILIPSCPQEFGTDSLEVQTSAGMVCDTEYHLGEGSTAICDNQQVQSCPLFSLPLVASSLMPTDMSYQQCKADSAYAEDSSLSSVSSGSNTIASCDLVSRVEAGCQSSDEVGENEEAVVCDENPCYGLVPPALHACPPVEDDYQAFQNLVGPPDILFSQQRSVSPEERMDKCPDESFAKVPLVVPGLFNDVKVGQCLSQPQRPFLSLAPAYQPIPVTVESGYQRV